MENRLALYTSILPNERQLIVQDMKFYAFVHYTVNTFTGREWGDGKEPPAIFNPRCQDTDQWCQAIAAAGMKGVIITAKHHDGFCLWQTETTEHSIKNSPYKNGKGDVLAELSGSCKKYGLKMGVYLSPWDRNSGHYGTEKYNDFYIEQLTELLDGRYGEIFMLWLDGACAAHKDGKPVQDYDFQRIWSTALKLQPKICISGQGPDVRWVGNERGKCRESEWNVVPNYKMGQIGAQDDEDYKKFQKHAEKGMVQDMGSREFLKDFDKFMWYPAEVDVSIRRGWFHHGKWDFTTKSLRKLMKIYYDSTGGNALLLLNIPPTKDGIFAKRDVKRLREMGRRLKREQSLKIAEFADPGFVEDNEVYRYEFSFARRKIDRLRMEEDTTKSQRVERFEVYAQKKNGRKLVYSGTVIGFGKMATFKPVVTDELIVEVTQCRFEPYLKTAEVFAVGGISGGMG
ncbi:MAG: alpha-L-fucosidase [Oscillospiraceae bacterium]|nr:alpha-L-fucosidase [Oscillospiraceae bacterium]